MRMREHRFLIPVVRDSDGQSHDPYLWTELHKRLANVFGGYTESGYCRGGWVDWGICDGKLVTDTSAEYAAAFDIDDSRLCAEFAELIIWIKRAFDQQCIYCRYCDAALL